MITQFKIFENDGEKDYDDSYNLYKEGDYVMIHDEYGYNENDDTHGERRGVVDNVSYYEDDGWQYDILLFDGSLNMGLLENGIERELTNEEAEEWKIKMQANKFNL
jgi:hypothetical protein